MYRAQLALLVSDPPSGPEWLHELKLDGYRIGVIVDGGSVRLLSRRGNDWTSEFPELVASAKKLRVKQALLDGEVVMLSDKGISSFEALQRRGRERGELAFFAFDLLGLDGHDVAREPLIERKKRLRDLVGRGAGIIRYTEHFDEDGANVLRQACALGAEGIVSKRRDAPYRWGARHADWRKSKCSKRQEFVVGGFTDPSGSRVGVGSMLIGYYEGDALRFAGKVGTGRGWSASFGRDLRRKLEAIAVKESPFHPRPPGWLGKNAHWVKPKHVVEVEFTEWTAGGHVRHPSLQGFRKDKSPTDVVRERPAVIPGNARRRQAPAANSPLKAFGMTEAGRLVFPKIRVRQKDLIDLYAAIGEWALPHVQDRPLTVVRCRTAITRPDALRSQCSFARHTARESRWAPADMPRVQIEEKKKVGEYAYVETIDHLLGMISRDVIEWHVWNARADDVEKPDRLVFDLDPGERVTWMRVVAAARRVRDVLDGLALASWVKTTGGRGLHVVVPFRRGPSWDDAFAFSRTVAEAIAQDDPKRYTISFAKADRGGRVLIDYKRNHRTSIAVAGFSLRANPEATISVPVNWDDIARATPERFTIKTIRAHLRGRDDPWTDYWSSRQRLRLTRSSG